MTTLDAFIDHISFSTSALAAADSKGLLVRKNDAFANLLGLLDESSGIPEAETIWELPGIDMPPKPEKEVTDSELVGTDDKHDSDFLHLTLMYSADVLVATKAGPEVNVRINAKTHNEPDEDLWFEVHLETSKIPIFSVYTPWYGLKEQFNKVMQYNRSRLFRDFGTYIAHLPYRQRVDGLWQKLCDSPYYIREEDMDAMVNGLESQVPGARPTVKYTVAPSGSGKTTSVAAAFVRSASSERALRFSHYLYMAFANNKQNNFQAGSSVASVDSIAYLQGADFLFHCVKELLEAKMGGELIPISDDPPLIHVTTENLKTMLFASIPSGRILFHIDEHRKMHDNAHFRRGAMGLLANLGSRIQVIATYIEPPVEVPVSSSSGICRFPIAVPLLNIRTAMKEVEELNFPVDPATLDASNQRLWATLLFRLGSFLKVRLNLLHLRSDSHFSDFLAEFQNVCRNFDPNEADGVATALKKCIQLCPHYNRQWDGGRPKGCDPAELLLGLSEDALDDIDGKIGSGLVAFLAEDSDMKFTATVGALVYDRVDPLNAVQVVFEDGAGLFKDHIRSNNLLSSAPLERAYLWTLTTKAASSGKLEFMQNTKGFRIFCNRIEPARIFGSNYMESFDLDTAKALEQNVVYYVDEGKGGNSSHPFGDIFFRSNNDEVVLIDITGAANTNGSEKKGKRLAKWIEYAKEKEKATKTPTLTFYGVVLAPFVKAPSHKYAANENVLISLDSDARGLLGGLAQFMAWFPWD